MTELDSGWCNKRKEFIFISTSWFAVCAKFLCMRACRTWCWLSLITSLALAVMCVGIWALVAKGNREELWNDLGLIPSLGEAGKSQCLKEEVVPILSSVQAGLTEGVKGSRWVSSTVMLIGKWNLAPSLGNVHLVWSRNPQRVEQDRDLVS